jgi:ubiquinol-cytochrome c reductase iron-sulfur subunit
MSDPHRRRRDTPVVIAFSLAILAGVGLAVVYWLGGQTQIEGALLAIALLGVGLGLIYWGKKLLPPAEVTEPRHMGPSPAEDRAAVEASLSAGEQELARRTLLIRLLLGAAAALGLAALFPIRSLGPSPGDTLYRTPWRRGMRLRDETGQLVKSGELEQGSFATVFPETSPGSADGQAVLVRVDPSALRLPEDRADGAPDGYVCYSKVCTHLGCPIGLYLAQTHELRCPCHQSTFDVLNGAEPVYGPADRPLPQLLLEVDADGYLVAMGDFTGPVGPGFWTIDKGPEGTGMDPL